MHPPRILERSLWYWERLRAMSAGEIESRLTFAARKVVWRHRRVWAAPAARVAPLDAWVLPPPPASAQSEMAQLLAEADRSLAGSCELLNVAFSTTTPQWHTDPQTGRTSPLSLAADIDYRDRSVAGNVKNIWELNRHRHLTVIAVAYALTREERYAQEIHRQLLSWLASNPVAQGVNWHSSLELGVRLLAWVWIERLLRGSPQHAELFGRDGKMWPAIYWHQWMIVRHGSRGSSANNHLVGEMVGLFIASTVWPYFEASARWRAASRQTLEREILAQTFPSGLNREQAFAYHCFSLELFLLAALEAGRSGVPFSHDYTTTVQRMLSVIPKVADVAGNLPRYGDEDGATALQLQPSGVAETHWLRWVSHAWGGGALALPRDGSGALAAALIWPPSCHVRAEPCDQSLTSEGSHAFDDAGVFVLASDRGAPGEIFCLADAGPLGFLSIAAHGHADALSFALSVGGVPVIVDPGTGSYFGDPLERAYFRGTRGHNTICIDDRDQSDAAGPFLWKNHARCRVLAWQAHENGAELVAEHDGYARLPGSVVHRRHLSLTRRELQIADELRGTATHTLEWRLHFHPLCTVELHDGECQARWSGGALEIALDPGLAWRLARAEPQAGWYSRAHNMKEPATTLIGRCETEFPKTLHNVIRVIHAPAMAAHSRAEIPKPA